MQSKCRQKASPSLKSSLKKRPNILVRIQGLKSLIKKLLLRGGQIALESVMYVPGEKSEHVFLKKIGNEWKVNDIQ